MSAVIDVVTSDGQKHRHVESLQNGRLEVREREDGGVDILGVRESEEIRAWGGDVTRPARRDEQILGSYPPDSTVVHVAS